VPDARTLLTWCGKAGYAARGVVYVLVGFLLLWFCFEGGAMPSGSRDALATLTDEPLGGLMLWVVALGLLCYSLWRFVQGGGDSDGHGTDLKGLAVRGALIVSGLTHLPLAWSAAAMAHGDDGSGGNWALEVLRQPFGQWLLGLIGVTIAGAGIANAWRGWKSRFMKWFSASQYELGILFPICRFGLVARGVVFVIIGLLVIRGAWRMDPSDADGMRSAFAELLQHPFGLYLLILVGLGLLAFAVYSGVESRYRRITMPVSR
jgi:hypothetical protein